MLWASTRLWSLGPAFYYYNRPNNNLFHKTTTVTTSLCQQTRKP